eukprot:TRINITY_DN10249_c0_g2_i1.p3 TRINITY_DN10249_c0_g2~~TRINITY_DN10249_c0_g2_i1.p3  ORF type:complete len:250 (+),score=102.48 TRINITY_DN10249_c0_g2_i1:85-750(+)
MADPKLTFTEAFQIADDVLYQGVKGVTDLIINPGLINLDFADVKAVMTNAGMAIMGTAEAKGEGRAMEAVESAMNNPLLQHDNVNKSRGVLISISGGNDLTLFEINEITSHVREQVHRDATIIFGSSYDSSLEGGLRVSVIVTGMDGGDSGSVQDVVSPPSSASAVKSKRPISRMNEQQLEARQRREAAKEWNGSSGEKDKKEAKGEGKESGWRKFFKDNW